MSNDNGEGNGRHAIALWAGLTALFANLAVVQVVALIGDESNPVAEGIAAIITAFIVAAGVYSKQRWDDATTQREQRERERRSQRKAAR